MRNFRILISLIILSAIFKIGSAGFQNKINEIKAAGEELAKSLKVRPSVVQGHQVVRAGTASKGINLHIDAENYYRDLKFPAGN